VVAADPAAGLRTLLPLWLEQDGDIRVEAVVATGAELCSAAALHGPDVVLVDLRLPDVTELSQLVGELHEREGLRVVVLAGLPPDAAATVAERAGADAALAKASSPEAMRDLVRGLTAEARAERTSEAEITLGTEADSVARARSFVEEQLRGLISPNAVGNAKIVVSELITNALRHGEGRPRLRISRASGRLRLEVIDDGTGQAPEIREEGGRASGGFGLRVVEQLSVRWGAFEGTTHVWAELDTDA
jgi:DNA-binding NarL/FixJ family response regulator